MAAIDVLRHEVSVLQATIASKDNEIAVLRAQLAASDPATLEAAITEQADSVRAATALVREI